MYTVSVLLSLFLNLLLIRAELQRVLAEVTDHMEQQYSAHQYLEKLRSENESLALKEKERQVYRDLVVPNLTLKQYYLCTNWTNLLCLVSKDCQLKGRTPA